MFHKKCLLRYLKIIPKFTILIWVCSFLFAPNIAFSQNTKSIKAKQQRIQKELQKLNKKLKATKKDESKLNTKVDLLSDKIKLSETYLDITCQLIDDLDDLIIQNQAHLLALNQSGENLNDKYRKALNDAILVELSVEPLGQILSFNNINNSNLQKFILQDIQSRTVDKIEINTIAQDSTLSLLSTLNEQRIEKDSLQFWEGQIRQEMVTDLKQQQNLKVKSQNATKSIKKDIRKKLKEKARLQKDLERIIKEEIRLANITKSKKKKKKTTKSIKVKSLLWPVSQKEIIGRFGKHRHPELKDVMVQNNGIDIKSFEGEHIKSISTGTVITITQIPGYETAVIISHEDVFILYSGLEYSELTKGEKIKKDTIIGYTSKGNKESPSRLHLEIWRGKTAINPLKFLK